MGNANPVDRVPVDDRNIARVNEDATTTPRSKATHIQRSSSIATQRSTTDQTTQPRWQRRALERQHYLSNSLSMVQCHRPPESEVVVDDAPQVDSHACDIQRHFTNAKTSLHPETSVSPRINSLTESKSTSTSHSPFSQQRLSQTRDSTPTDFYSRASTSTTADRACDDDGASWLTCSEVDKARDNTCSEADKGHDMAFYVPPRRFSVQRTAEANMDRNRDATAADTTKGQNFKQNADNQMKKVKIWDSMLSAFDRKKKRNLPSERKNLFQATQGIHIRFSISHFHAVAH